MQFKDTMITAGGLIFQQATSFFIGVYITRSIGVNDYGSLTVARNWSVIILTLTPLGLDLALLRYLPTIQKDRALAFWQLNTFRLLVFIVNLLTFAIAWSISGYLQEHIYRFSSFSILFVITMAVLPFSADVNILSTYYKVFNRPGVFSLLTSYLQTTIRSIMSLMAIWLGFAATGVATATTGSTMLASAIISLHLWRSFSKDLPSAERALKTKLTDVRAVLGDSVWMALNLSVYGATRSADVVVLGMFVSSREVGSYGALSLIAYLVSIYPQALSQTLGPIVARHFHEGDRHGLSEILSRYIRLASMISSFIFGGVAAFGDRLDLLLGKSYVISPMLALLLPLGYLVSGVLGPMGYALSMTGKHRLELIILTIGVMTLIALLFLLIPMWGAVGAALAVVVSFVLNNIIRFYFVIRHIGFTPGSYRDLIPPLVALVLGYGARWFTNVFIGADFADITAGCFLFAFLYGLVTWTLLMLKEDRSILISKFR